LLDPKLIFFYFEDLSEEIEYREYSNLASLEQISFETHLIPIKDIDKIDRLGFD